MFKRGFILMASFTLLAGCAQSMDQLGGQNSSTLSSGDNQFLKMITVSNETEIQSSKLALSQSQNQAIKNFANQMITDHQAAEAMVSRVATQKGAILPTQINKTDRQTIHDLKAESGHDFDRAYLDMQIAAHKATISADEDEANNGFAPEVKTLANELLPTLQLHLHMAQKLESGM